MTRAWPVVAALALAACDEPGTLAVAPGAFDFGLVTDGDATDWQAFAFINRGDAATGPVAIALAGEDADDFEIISDDCSGATLAGGTRCHVGVRLHPQPGASGTRLATLTATATPGGSAVVDLSGVSSVAASLVLDGSGAFGDVTVGGFATRVLTVTNPSLLPTMPLQITLAGDGAFRLRGGAAGDCVAGVTTLAAGASCNLRVELAPEGSGLVTGQILISAEGLTGTFVGLSGNGVRMPELIIDLPPTLQLGPLEVGVASPDFSVNVTNLGDLPTSTPVVTTSSPELVVTSSTCTEPLPPLGGCTLGLSFTPADGSFRSAQLTVGVIGSSATLVVTATGLWRLTVERDGPAGTITSSPAGINCPAVSCSGLFLPGGVTLQARTTNGSGAHFAGWSGPLNGTCASGPQRDCTAFVDGATSVSARFLPITANLAFVTSSVFASTLGGAGPYDAACNSAATTAGINNADSNAYIAWLSSPTSSAADRLRGAVDASGWVRMDGRVFATSAASLLRLTADESSAILNPVRYAETGADLGDASYRTGANPDGEPHQNCTGWTGQGTAAGGSGLSGGVSWTAGSVGSCGGSQRLLCLMKQFGGGAWPATFAGKKVWLTDEPFLVSAATDPDSHCHAQRPAGVAQGRALIARVGVAASSLLDPAQMYVRVDGQEVGTGAELAGNVGRAGIWQTGSGRYPAPEQANVFTGSTNIGLPGTVASTCDNWTDPSDPSVPIGHAHRARQAGWSSSSAACSGASPAPRLYCFEP